MIISCSLLLVAQYFVSAVETLHGRSVTADLIRVEFL